MLYAEDFKDVTCSHEECMKGDHECDESPLFLSGRCHPGEPVVVAYLKETKALMFWCAVCEEPITEVKVASRHNTHNTQHPHDRNTDHHTIDRKDTDTDENIQ